MVIRQLLEEFSEDVIRAFVQKNADYYLVKWKLMAKTGSKTSWNWASAFFRSLWFFYRKMVAFGFGIMGIGFLVSLFFLPILRSHSDAAIIGGALIALTLIIALFVLMGLYGNYIYGSYAYKKLKELSLVTKDEEELKLLAMNKGGTSVGWVLLAFIINLIINNVFAALLKL